jgi:hypothetical protein
VRSANEQMEDIIYTLSTPEISVSCFFFLENAQESCAPLYIKKIGKKV